MYEATVNVEKVNSHLLDYVKRKLVPYVNEVDGVSTELSGDDRDYFSFACVDTYRFQAQRMLADVAAQALSLGYKNLYMRDLLKTDSGSFYQNVLVNTVCIFDNECDRQLISRLIDVRGTVCLDGYYNFRMDAVKKKWSEISKLLSDNLYALSDEALIGEFLQYLLESLPCKVKKLSVVVEQDGYTLFGSDNQVIEPLSSLARDTCVEEEIMLNALILKPQSVKLYSGVPLRVEFTDMLQSLFETEFIQVN